jgi:small nuclear ribonucleoprotein (snRNP)-like protein
MPEIPYPDLVCGGHGRGKRKPRKNPMAGKKKPSSEKTNAGGRRQSLTRAREMLRYRNRHVVLDTTSHYVYIGKLEDVSEHFIVLKDTDVHDRRESPSMNEQYIHDAKKYGVRQNRKLVHVRIEEVISFSLLGDVIEY